MPLKRSPELDNHLAGRFPVVDVGRVTTNHRPTDRPLDIRSPISFRVKHSSGSASAARDGVKGVVGRYVDLV